MKNISDLYGERLAFEVFTGVHLLLRKVEKCGVEQYRHNHSAHKG